MRQKVRASSKAGGTGNAVRVRAETTPISGGTAAPGRWVDIEKINKPKQRPLMFPVFKTLST